MSSKNFTVGDFAPDKLPMHEAARTVYKCGQCGQVQAHDYVPYGLGRGIWFNSCICSAVDSNWIHRAKTVAVHERA